MKSLSLVALSLLLLPFVTSCTPALSGSAPQSSLRSAQADPDDSDRVRVRSGSQTVAVAELKKAVRETASIVKARKGYLESSIVREDEEAELQLRVPSASLEPTLDEIALLGKETFRRVAVEDVTVEHIDLEAELANLRALRDRLRALLARAATVEEALEVEKELAKVQTRIDALASRLATLQNRVVYSRIALSLERKRTPGPLTLAGKAVALSVKKLFVLK